MSNTNTNSNNGYWSNGVFYSTIGRQLPPLGPSAQTPLGPLPAQLGGNWLARDGGSAGNNVSADVHEYELDEQLEAWRRRQYGIPGVAGYCSEMLESMYFGSSRIEI
ncbi:hypothetical protein TI39_contig605g00005 [Zymoseptoria brevis]|uniref:Uncharacterized protein n=1 Tax=Zymoseptoria brevis TaxID=1047168 RepID=A0A0F4GGW8_9PEZI|nr:hypothetical protein TI39_contig605g00005 [Zymoseptoria brevis]